MTVPTMPHVIVIVLNWNGADDTIACVASLRKSNYPHFEILVVDNGSTDNSAARIKNVYPDLWMIETGINLGFAGGNNAGITAALQTDARIIVLLNNDTTVDPRWLAAFADEAQRRPSGSVLGGKIFYFDNPEVIWHFGALWDSKACRLKLIGRGDDSHSWQQVEPVDHIIGCCMWIPRTTFETVGLLEEAFFLNYEETDWCFSARKLGFSLFSVPTVLIWHKISASFKSRPHNTYFIFRNRRLWLDRQFTADERKRILRIAILPEEARARRKYFLRRLQKIMYRAIGLSYPTEKAEKLKNAAAALEGLADYKAGRFGNCPDWILNRCNNR